MCARHTAEASRQYTYGPYGDVLAVDAHPTLPLPVNRIGHQGLFFERLTTGSVTSPTLAVGARGLYHSRNRWLHTELGRFLTRDPAEAALPILTALAFNGDTLDGFVSGFSPTGHYADGFNLYQFVGSNPANRIDPLGLEWGLEGEIDDLIADRTGHAMYALATLNEGAKWASLGLQTTLSIAWSLLPGSGLYDAFKAVQVLASGKGGFWDALDLATAAFPLAAKGLHAIGGLRGIGSAFGWASRACNCFAAGTMVDTPAGQRPIEELDVGDEVWTIEQDAPGGPARVGQVTAVFRSVAPVMLWLFFTTGDAVTLTPAHEVWTHEDGWTVAGLVQVGDHFRTADGRALAVATVLVDRRPTPVYNLEVDGTFTYFAAGVWVHNNSCRVGRQLLMHRHHLLPKFLGGLEGGAMTLLPEHLHRAYHGGLLTDLAAAGIHKERSMSWVEYFNTHDDMQPLALSTLVAYTQRFDAANGTSLLQKLLQALGG